LFSSLDPPNRQICGSGRPWPQKSPPWSADLRSASHSNRPTTARARRPSLAPIRPQPPAGTATCTSEPSRGFASIHKSTDPTDLKVSNLVCEALSKILFQAVSQSSKWLELIPFVNYFFVFKKRRNEANHFTLVLKLLLSDPVQFPIYFKKSFSP
jgi:hypothetical protein